MSPPLLGWLRHHTVRSEVPVEAAGSERLHPRAHPTDDVGITYRDIREHVLVDWFCAHAEVLPLEGCCSSARLLQSRLPPASVLTQVQTLLLLETPHGTWRRNLAGYGDAGLILTTATLEPRQNPAVQVWHRPRR